MVNTTLIAVQYLGIVHQAASGVYSSALCAGLGFMNMALKSFITSMMHHGQLIKWTLIARVFVDLFRGLKGLFSLVHV